MRKIEILTPQNVPVQYELAGVRLRGMAFLIDSFILGSLILLLTLFIESGSNTASSRQALYITLVVPVFLFYNLAFEVFMQGQSPGKRIAKIRVIKLTGRELELSDFLLRWSFRWLDIWASLGTIASLQINSTEKAQRIGDLLADTTVIKSLSKFQVSLNDLLKLKSISNTELKYPQAAAMTEQEMLLIKSLLDRQRKLRNPVHNQLTARVADTVADRLQLPRPDKKREFLLNILADYVTITRS